MRRLSGAWLRVGRIRARARARASRAAYAYGSAMTAIVGMKIDVTQLTGLQILKIDDVQLDESSARGGQVILWDKVPINLFNDEIFLKDPFKYITEEGFKLKDQKIVISKTLKHDKDLEMKTLSFHCIPMNFGDRTNEHQPCFLNILADISWRLYHLHILLYPD